MGPRVVIIGAGMAGVALAHELAVRRKVRDVVLVEEREPLGLTSSKGTEAYRNWWPSAPMVELMNRSIDRLEALAVESGARFGMNRRGYLFLTASATQRDEWRRSAALISALGAGALREHRSLAHYQRWRTEGLDGERDGADLIDDPSAVQALLPFARGDAIAALHVRRAGWMKAAVLGAYLLERAVAAGAALIEDRAVGLGRRGDRIVEVRLASGRSLEADAFVLAAGPLLPELLALLGLDLPVANELHGKAAFDDPQGAVPRDVPLLIWSDPLELDVGGARRFFPGGVHFRPRHDRELLAIWTYDARLEPARFPPRFDSDYGEILFRGLARLIPSLDGPTPIMRVDGGYYAKTPDNRPLLGPTSIEGLFLLGALSGFGVMASQAAAELVGSHVLGDALPSYAHAFLPSRFADPAYVAGARDEGQL